MKLLKDKIVLIMTLVLVLSLIGCCLPEKGEIVNTYKYVEITIDDLPVGKDIEAILFMNHYHPEIADIMLVVGNQETVEEIVGHEIFPDKVLNDPSWQYRLFSNFKDAKRVKRMGCLSDARAVFITKEKAYMLKIASGADEKSVYGPNYESAQLKQDFDELGLN